MDIAKLFDISGESALVTGATGALGSAAARALVSAGAHVTLAGGNADKLATITASPVFLTSDASSIITGEIINVDGGFSANLREL